MAASIAWMFVLVKPLAHGGLALAVTLGALLQMVLLFIMLRRKLGKIDGRRMAITLFKTLVASLLMGIVVMLWANLLTIWMGVGKIGSLIVLISGALVGVAIFALLTKLFKMEEYGMALGCLAGRDSVTALQRYRGTFSLYYLSIYVNLKQGLM